MFQTFSQDRSYIENKFHKTDEPFDAYQRMAYHGYDYDESTGLTDDEIKEGLRRLSKETEDLPHPVAKAMAVRYVLEHTRIDVNEHDYFVGLYTWNRVCDEVTLEKWKRELFSENLPEEEAIMEDFNASGAVGIWPDFDHVVPDWDSIMKLGFPGLRERAREYRKQHEENGTLTDRQRAYFDGIETEYTAIISFIDRLYQYALTKTHEKAPRYAACLKHLRDGAPTDIYEAMQLIYLYFMISESVDHYQVRSLGNGLDHTLYPFYQRDLENGTYTREEIREFLAYFLMQWSAIGNYWGQPFYMGGTNPDGSSKINPLSHDIIDVYRELGIFNPKIQIKYNPDMPAEFLNKVLDMVRSACGDVVFCCERGMMKAVMSYGGTYEEALSMDIRGCYETGVRANEVSTTSGYVNPLKAVEFVFTDGYDPVIKKQVGIRTGAVENMQSFAEFYTAFLKQYEYLVETSIRLTNAFEQYMEAINPSSLYSATVTQSLERAFDAYQGGVKFNNCCMLNCGLGTAVDAVMAVKYLVFDRKETTLAELKQALADNWEGHEVLRKKALNCPHKFGNGDVQTDLYAEAISKFFCSRVNGRKNARGGVYKAIMHSAMQFVWQGNKTGATPDGRRAGDEISKNASPTPGMDRNGITALLQSAISLVPTLYPESFCLDAMLHTQTVSGEKGLVVLKSILDSYYLQDGMSLQFNVFDTEVLKDAQKNPQKYPNLQVRICGWNALWNTVPKKEQDAYILRAETIR